MVDSEYNIDTYKSVKISIGAVMKYPEMLKFVPNHLKTKQLTYLLRYVLDQYKTQQMCYKAVLENAGT